jgi:hypothetical protein
VLAFIAIKEPDAETLVALDDFQESFTSMVQGMKLLEKHAGECENYIQPTTQ